MVTVCVFMHQCLKTLTVKALKLPNLSVYVLFQSNEYELYSCCLHLFCNHGVSSLKKHQNQQGVRVERQFVWLSEYYCYFN